MRSLVRWGVVCACAAAALAVWAQDAANPVVSSAKEIVTRQGAYIVSAAEMMPADKYGYKPTPDQWTFGKIVAHVVQANDHVCAMLTTAPPPASGASVTETTAKETLVTAIKESVAYCNAAFDTVKDAQLGDTITFFGGAKKPRARALVEVVADLEDHYSQMASYLRLNGMLPPSAKPKK